MLYYYINTEPTSEKRGQTESIEDSDLDAESLAVQWDGIYLEGVESDSPLKWYAAITEDGHSAAVHTDQASGLYIVFFVAAEAFTILYELPPFRSVATVESYSSNEITHYFMTMLDLGTNFLDPAIAAKQKHEKEFGFVEQELSELFGSAVRCGNE